MFSVFIKSEKWQKYAKRLFGCLFFAAFLMGFLYIYFMNVAVLKTAERNENLREFSETKRDLQKLEAEYIDKLERLSVSYAKTLGFVEGEPVKYISGSKVVVKGREYASDFR